MSPSSTSTTEQPRLLRCRHRLLRPFIAAATFSLSLASTGTTWGTLAVEAGTLGESDIMRHESEFADNTIQTSHYSLFMQTQ